MQKGHIYLNVSITVCFPLSLAGLPPEGQQRQPVLVATCHIHWDPEYCDVKLIQTMMLMAELKNIVEESQTKLRPGASTPDANSIPLLLCGDLNSLPESGGPTFLWEGWGVGIEISVTVARFYGIKYSQLICCNWVIFFS